ncbi:MAG: FkbM family methyltransferase [Acetobacteraceae bacterium]|nr:FkbM family methyltransferase [Acetobacteraceae bacterium]
MDLDIPRLFALQDRANIFEAIIADLYLAVLRPGDLAVDGGANEGLHTFPLAELVEPSGQVLAFEPIAWRAETLARVAQERGLPQLRVFARALAEHDGTAPFHWVRNSDGYSGLRPRAHYPFAPDMEMLTVRTVALDGLLDGARPWRFCKLDLEGGEFRALQGAARALGRHRPLVVFESDRAGSAHAHGYSPEEFFGFFDALGYRLSDLFGRPFARTAWDSPGYPHYYIGFHGGAGEHERVERDLPGILRRALAAAA